MRTLVVGGYGLVGAEIARAMLAEGYRVTGFGRSLETGQRIIPDIPWRRGDMRQMQTAEAWSDALESIEVVVNASGALQDGARDDLAKVQDGAIRALIAACEAGGVKSFIQISAIGATPDAPTAFLRTKAAADAALRKSSLRWAILKPGLVISANAYGGTALLRMLAAVPLVQPIVLADAKVQTVSARDVARAVISILDTEVPFGQDYELVEPEARTLCETVKLFRWWAGRKPARAELRLPRWAGYALAKVADLAGWLGWRSPLRTTALKSLEAGVTGDPVAWRRAGGFELESLKDTLLRMPATAQERVFGRAQLVFPLLVVTLSAFWIVSGVIGLLQRDAAVAVLQGRVSDGLAGVLVDLGSVLDLAIGVALLWRSWVRRAAWASILVSLGYLAAGTWLTPELWDDPLGPFVKVLPAMALALTVAALAEDR
jgi:uncharacterized protein YbjT (DUF2867 family)